MAAIPTILKGDDSGSITLTLATGRSYAGATLVVAYQGVTRQFTDLTPGQTVTFAFTHDETSDFALGCHPLLMRLVGQYGAEETVENAEFRVKVTDCLAEVNAGGTFIVKPGEQGASGKVPITDLGDVNKRYTLADLQAKINEIVHVLAQRSLLALALCASAYMPTALAAATNAWTCVVSNLYSDAVVYTNIPDWAQDPNPPVSMTDNAVIFTNAILKTKGGETVPLVSSNEVNELHHTVQSWDRYLNGSNVVFSITNYISGTYRLDEAKLKILELTNGVYREVYNSRDEIALHETYFETNTLFAATNAIVAEANAKIDGKAPKAWGLYTSDGTRLSEVSISNTVYMTAPQTVFAGGTEWQRVTVGQGAIAVLTAHGAAAYSAGDAGTFHFTDFSSTNYFGWTKRSDFLIGCDTDAIRVTRVGQNNTVALYYSNVVSSTYPIMLYRPTLENFASNTWEQLNYEDGSAVEGASYAVEWATGTEAFTALISIPTNQPSGFFMAQTAVTGEAEFSTNMKADFKGGIVTTDGAHIIKPVYSDGDLTWRTFDYGSGLQVSTPSQSQVTSTAKSVSTRTVARALTTDEGTVPNVYDFQNGTNFTLQIYAALTNIIKTLGGTVTNAPTFNQ